MWCFKTFKMCPWVSMGIWGCSFQPHWSALELSFESCWWSESKISVLIRGPHGRFWEPMLNKCRSVLSTSPKICSVTRPDRVVLSMVLLLKAVVWRLYSNSSSSISAGFLVLVKIQVSWLCVNSVFDELSSLFGEI
jgi:hypothetical protein